MKRIGVFAGTFDPIHNGHLVFAEAALDAGLDKVYFLVEPRPRRKQGVRALEHRQKMVQLATKHHPKLGDIILERARFTPHDTLPLLRSRFKGAQLSLLFGDDVIAKMVDHIADWPHLEKLAESVSLVIAARHDTHQEIAKNLRFVSKITGVDFKYDLINLDKAKISSSKIRAVFKEGHKPNDMPLKCVQYALKNGLYTSSGSG